MMIRILAICVGAMLLCGTHAAHAACHADQATGVRPSVFAPGVISRASHDAAPAFTPDGRTVYFQQSNTAGSTILVSHCADGHWSKPVIASFSGKWDDMEPAMAADGSYLIFVSSRPVTPGGTSLDGYFNGKHHPGAGGNLWRVDRVDGHWGKPHRLPAWINTGSAMYAPAVGSDYSLYFMHPDEATGHFRLYRAAWRDGHYLKPKPLPFSTGATTDVDPVVGPDGRFMVFGSGRKPAADTDLFIVFHGAHGWGKPVHLGTVINSPGSDAEPRLSPDGRTLYFSSERQVVVHFPRTHTQATRDVQAASSWNNGLYNIWHVDLAAWLVQHGEAAFPGKPLQGRFNDLDPHRQTVAGIIFDVMRRVQVLKLLVRIYETVHAGKVPWHGISSAK